jgi:hypothetical protein
VADWEITAATPDEFATFLKAKDVKIGARYEVYLNSPGGSLLAGIKLGEIIRKYGLGTRVASTDVVTNKGGGGECGLAWVDVTCHSPAGDCILDLGESQCYPIRPLAPNMFRGWLARPQLRLKSRPR